MPASPVSLHEGGGTMAQQAVNATAPEGMLIAPIWKRIVALCLDAFLITIIVGFLTKGVFYAYLISWPLLMTKQAHYVLLSLLIHLIMYWLYFKYTGKSYGRSLGQRAMRIAIVHDDGTLLGETHWGKRATYKLRYVLPAIGVIIGLIDVYRIWKDGGQRSPIDYANHTIAAVDWSLPAITRGGLR